jgi:hypothetical protein
MVGTITVPFWVAATSAAACYLKPPNLPECLKLEKKLGLDCNFTVTGPRGDGPVTPR